MWDSDSLQIEILREFESCAHPPLGRERAELEGMIVVDRRAVASRYLHANKKAVYARQKQRRDANRAAGLCQRCSRMQAPNRKFCSRCLAGQKKQRERLRLAKKDA